MKKLLIGFIALVITLGVMTEIKAQEPKTPIIGENPFGGPKWHEGVDQNTPHPALRGRCFGLSQTSYINGMPSCYPDPVPVN